MSDLYQSQRGNRVQFALVSQGRQRTILHWRHRTDLQQKIKMQTQIWVTQTYASLHKSKKCRRRSILCMFLVKDVAIVSTYTRIKTQTIPVYTTMQKVDISLVYTRLNTVNIGTVYSRIPRQTSDRFTLENKNIAIGPVYTTTKRQTQAWITLESKRQT